MFPHHDRMPPSRRFVHEQNRWWTRRELYLHASLDLAEISPEHFRQIRVVTCVIAFVVLIGTPFVFQYWALGIPWMSIAVGCTIVGGLGAVALIRRTGRARLGGWIGTSLLLVLLTVSNVASGGFYDPNFAWLYVIPILAALVVDARAGWVFTGLVLLLTLGFFLAPTMGIEMPSLIPPEDHAMQSLFNRTSAITAIGVGLAALVSQQRFASRLLQKANDDLRDEMTRRQEASARLLHAERMASMGSVAASVAHEINNPLTYLSMNLAELRAQFKDASPEAHRMLDEAADGASRVQALVADLRTFSHEGTSDSAEPIDVDSAVKLAVRMVSNEARHRATLDVVNETGLFIEGHESRLVQVLLNLLTNALHAIPEGDKEHTVTLRVSNSDHQVVIEVIDDGAGMTEQTRARVFEPFFTTKPIGVGTGLGLSICRNLVGAMNGTLEIESEVNVGTTARVCFPAITPPARRDDSSGTFARAARTGLRVLVVDDERAILRAIKRVLSDHIVETTSSAREAVERCHHEEYDVVLCDLMMPELSGAELYAQLPERVRPRLVFMTGGVFTAGTISFMETVTNPVLHKPFNPATLKQAVADAIRTIEADQSVSS